MGENAVLLPGIQTAVLLNNETGEGHPRLTSLARQPSITALPPASAVLRQYLRGCVCACLRVTPQGGISFHYAKNISHMGSLSLLLLH